MSDIEILEKLGELERYLSAKEQMAGIGKGAETLLAWKNAVHAAGDIVAKMGQAAGKASVELRIKGNCDLDEIASKFAGSAAVLFPAPPEDAVPVVRCGECKRYPYCCRMPKDGENWFCADGEARNESI